MSAASPPNAWTRFPTRRIGSADPAASDDPAVARGGWAVALALFTTLSFLAGSPETLVWQLLIVGVLFVGAPRPAGQKLRASVIAAVLCVGLSAVLLFPAIEFLRLTTRGAGAADAVDWSASWAQLVAMGWPRADLPRGAYWGDDQWWMVTVFVGTAPCLLTLAGIGRARWARSMTIALLLLAALALGKHLPLTAWLWTHGPLGAFRFPAKFLVGVAFCIALLSAMGVDQLARRRPVSRVWLAAAIGIALVALLALPAIFRALGARAGLTQGLLWVLAVTLLICFAAIVPRGRKRRTRVALALLVVAELVLHHGLNRGFGWERPDRLDAPSTLAAAIPDGFHGRISLAITDALVGPRDPALPSFIDTSRDALVPNRHMEEGLRALEGYGAPEPRWLDEFQLIGERSVFDLTGVAYYVRAGPPPYPDLEKVAEGRGLPFLYRSSTALSRAFVVHRAEVVEPQVALSRLKEQSQPARTTALLNSGRPMDGACEGSRISFLRDTSSEVALEVDSCGPGYLVLSDAYFPGWSAEVDGRPSNVLRANYAMRAVEVGGGKHQVTFRYRPLSFGVGAAVTALTAIAAALILLRSRRRLSTQP